MTKRVLRWMSGVTVLLLVFATLAHAQNQNIDLAAGGADLVWRGPTPGANAGKYLDQGALSPGDNRRDLVVGAPGTASVAGRVYVLFGGPVWSGSMSLANANVVISGPGAGDGFGTATAVGPIIAHSSNMTANLAVGAPGALGGRGAVYVFATPLNPGALSHTNAAFIIEGAAGDRLGSALATADINGDGHREIVIGAPGNNRIYVIIGGPSKSGTRNLAITGGDLLITGAGIGNIIQAGDVTGDGLSEIIVGSPIQNAAFLLTGGYPAVTNLPADADAVFTGIDPGDAAGAALRILDLDADGRRDLLIGAPGADGPSNSRTNAGEAYIFWGRSVFSSANLANADVTFYGSTPHYALGEGITAGDTNRDTPNDAVFLVQGASAAGELLVYYGRARDEIGADIGGGRRAVDFASFPASRHIFGDPNSGTIATSLVYELTGEGARDVIVGVPADNEARGGAFFTISPKMILNPETIAISVVEDSSAHPPVVLENPSTIPITWIVASNRPWLSPSPGSGTSSLGAFGSVTLHISTVGLARGVHTGTVTFTSTSEHLEMFLTLDVTLTVTPAPCTYSVSPTALTVGSVASSRTVSVTTRTNCEWSASSGSAFITIPDGASRVGPGTVTVNVAANPSTSPRSGSVTVAGHTVPVNQQGIPTEAILRDRERARADFNADTMSDLVVQNLSTGGLSVWTLNGHTVTGTQPFSHSVASNQWRIAGTGDFNADGKPDIVWHHQLEGWVYLWYMNGATRIGHTYFSRDRVNPGWRIAAVGDFTSDGKPDIVWQNNDEGRIAIWMCDGATVTGFVELPVQFLDTQWRVAGAADFNADGDTDLLLRHVGYGEVGVWLMNGFNRTSYVTLSPGAIIDQAWQTAAIIDANGDTKPDIVWAHETQGWLAIWYMNGHIRTSVSSFAVSLPAGARVGGPK